MKGADFSESSISNTEFAECSLKYVNFTSSKLSKCEIRESDLSEAFFASCSLKQVILEKSQFINTEFFKTPLKGLDFSTCILEGISISTEGNELKGAIVNVYQAADLAKLLGVVIKD